MVGDTADAFRLSAESAHGAAEAFVKQVAPGFVNERRAQVCGENQVIMQRKMGGGHGRESVGNGWENGAYGISGCGTHPSGMPDVLKRQPGVSFQNIRH